MEETGSRRFLLPSPSPSSQKPLAHKVIQGQRPQMSIVRHIISLINNDNTKRRTLILMKKYSSLYRSGVQALVTCISH
jgi:hypothetical protein